MLNQTQFNSIFDWINSIYLVWFGSVRFVFDKNKRMCCEEYGVIINEWCQIQIPNKRVELKMSKE